MRGKDAIQAANRRAAASEAETAGLRAQIADERARIHVEKEKLKSEIVRMSRDIDEIAKARARSIVEKLDEERRVRGLDEAALIYLMTSKDYLIMNACRYLSMTLGQQPIEVIPVVLTWVLNRDFVEHWPRPDFDFLVGALGVLPDGWTARLLEQAQDPHWKHWGTTPGDAITLDRAQSEGDSRIHPNYQPRWYDASGPAPVPPGAGSSDRKSLRLKARKR